MKKKNCDLLFSPDHLGLAYSTKVNTWRGNCIVSGFIFFFLVYGLIKGIYHFDEIVADFMAMYNTGVLLLSSGSYGLVIQTPGARDPIGSGPHRA